jgi:hypothetical protein
VPLPPPAVGPLARAAAAPAADAEELWGKLEEVAGGPSGGLGWRPVAADVVKVRSGRPSDR